MAQRAASLLGASVAAGTSHIRSHVDVDTVAGLDSLYGVGGLDPAGFDRRPVEHDGYGLEPGCWADLTLVPAETIGEAVVAHPPRSLVLKRGRVVATRADEHAGDQPWQRPADNHAR